MKVRLLCSCAGLAVAVAGAAPVGAQQAPSGTPVQDKAGVAPQDLSTAPPPARAANPAAPPAAATAEPAPAPGSSDGGSGSEIVVTGVRASAASSLAIKRGSLEVVDSIVAEDIGKLPDNNVAQALQRITGVQTRGSGVAIRGLQQVQTVLNGRNFFTLSGRGVDLNSIPSELLAGVDVYKSSAADQIEGGIGGLIDIRTRKPFDFKGLEVAGSARGVWGDIDKKVGPYLSGLVSDRWDTGIGEVGALVSVAYHKTPYGSYRNAAGPYPSRTDIIDLDGDGTFPNDPDDAVRSSDTVGTRYLDGVSQNLMVNFAGQWKPTSSLEFGLDGFYQTAQTHENDRLLYVRAGNTGLVSGAAMLEEPFTFHDGTNVVETGTYTNARANPITYFVDNFYRTYQVTGSGKWTHDRLTLTGELGYTRSTGHNRQSELDLSATLPVAFFDVTSKIPDVTVPDFDLTDPAAYTQQFLGETLSTSTGTEKTARLDARFEAGLPFLRTLIVGFRYADRGSSTDGVSSNLDAASRGLAGYTTPGLISETPDNAFGSYDVMLNQFAVPDPSYLKDPSFLRELYGVGPGRPANDPLRSYDISEKTYAGYAEGLFDFAVAGLPIDGNYGLRVIRTEESVNGFSELEDGSYAPVAEASSNTQWLPSINLRAKLTPNLFLRAAASKTITRPDFGQLSPTLTLSYIFANGSAGNPALGPLKSDNYDVSLEYYFSKSSTLYAAGFVKKVNGFVQTITDDEDINGETFSITRPSNGGNGTVKGIEVGYQQFFTFLPGFLSGLGLQANYTYVDSSVPSGGTDQNVPLEGLSKNSYNLVGIYEKGPVSLRVAYNWRSKFVSQTVGSADGLPLYNTSLEGLDASFNYNLTEDVTFAVDATNITHPLSRDYYGYKYIPKSANQGERVLQVGLRAKL